MSSGLWNILNLIFVFVLFFELRVVLVEIGSFSQGDFYVKFDCTTIVLVFS